MHIKTTEYLSMVREKTGFSDYKIAKEYDINQSNLSKYSSGKAALSETHAWLFANVLDIDPAEVVANTKLEHASIFLNGCPEPNNNPSSCSNFGCNNKLLLSFPSLFKYLNSSTCSTKSLNSSISGFQV